MGERKVINNYIPPDFDPSIIPKMKRDKDKKIEVRMMLPFSLRCNTCGEYMYRGKKFNSKSEICKGEDYLGIKRFRFYIKCCVCSAEITFKTDPKNSDYECEYGASRNFELWREKQAAADENAKEQEEIEEDAMKALESKTMDNQREMDIMDSLEEIKELNTRHLKVDTEKLLEKLEQKRQATITADDLKNKPIHEIQLSAADEALVKGIQFGKKNLPKNDDSQASFSQKSGIAEPSQRTSSDLVSSIGSALAKGTVNNSNRPNNLSSAPIIIKKRKIESLVASGEDLPNKNQKNAEKPSINNSIISASEKPKESDKVPEGMALGLLGMYGDDDEDD